MDKKAFAAEYRKFEKYIEKRTKEVQEDGKDNRQYIPADLPNFIEWLETGEVK